MFKASSEHYAFYKDKNGLAFATLLDKCAVKMMRCVYHQKEKHSQPLIVTSKTEPDQIAEEEVKAEDPITKEGLHLIFYVIQENGTKVSKCWGCLKRDRELFQEGYKPDF